MSKIVKFLTILLFITVSFAGILYIISINKPEGKSVSKVAETEDKKNSKSEEKKSDNPKAEKKESDKEKSDDRESVGNEAKENSGETDSEKVNRVEARLLKMTLEEKVAQLFITNPSDLTGVKAIRAGKTTEERLKEYPISGFIIQDDNLVNPEQITKMLKDAKKIAKKLNIPSLIFCIDEEGGRVLRIGDNPNFPDAKTDSMFNLVKKAKTEKNSTLIYDTGAYIGGYLKKYGFNMDLAPVADVWTNPDNKVIGDRAFSNDAGEVAKYSLKFAEGLESCGITPVFKHFPGHGNTVADSHVSSAVSDKNKKELMELELIPFKNAIDNGAKVIMVSHVTLTKIDKNNPASLSYKITTELLRKELGFKGIIMTDSLNMNAAVNAAGNLGVAVRAIKAGNDILLIGSNFNRLYNEVLDAVKNGTIKEKRIDESVRRILEYKEECIEGE